MIKNERLTALLEQVEQKFCRGDSSEWKNRDFEELNFEINLKTKTIISALTLKRIFGKIKTAEDYLPQKATIKALEQYADFVMKNVSDSTLKNEIPTDEEEIETINQTKKTGGKWGWMLFVGLFIVGAMTLWYKELSKSANQMGKITLLKTEGFNPKTATFEYLTPNQTDSFKIRFDEDFMPVNISNGNKTISYFFQSPGIFRVRMLANEKVVSDTTTVIVETKGWQSLAYYFEQDYKKRFFSIPIKNLENSYFHPRTEDLISAGMDISKIIVLRLDNFHPTGVDGDNFSLNTTVKNTDHWTGVHCNSIYLRIFGRKETIDFRFTNPGCSYWISCKFGEKTFNLTNGDVSDFVFDISEWQNIRVENKNKQLDLFVNNVKRFTNSYNKSLGEIVGVSILFHGNGYVKSYQLTDLKQKVVFGW